MSDEANAQQSAFDNLDEEQKKTLTFFQEMTSADAETSKDILSNNNWDLVQASRTWFGDNLNDSPPPTSSISLSSAESSSSPLRPLSQPLISQSMTVRRRVNTSSSSGEPSFSVPRRENNPPPPRRQIAEPGLPQIAWNLISSPFKFAFSKIYNILHFPFRFVWQFLYAVDPREHVTDPVGDVRKYVQAFATRYPDSPNFIEDTFDKASQQAKKELKFLMVFLHNPKIPKSIEFEKNVIAHPSVIEHLNREFLVWACSNDTPEGFRVSKMFATRSYPTSAIMCPVRNRMMLVAKLSSEHTSVTFVNRLKDIKSNHQYNVTEAIKERERLQANQNIRSEQDRAYAQALELDQQKMRQRIEEREERARVERLQREKAEAKRNKKIEHEKRRALCASKLTDNEPGPDVDTSSIVKLRIKLTDGKNVGRNFNATDKIDVLHDFVYAQSCSPRSLRVLKTYPRQPVNGCSTKLIDEALADSQPLLTLEESGLVTNETLFVESTVESDDDSSSDEESST